MEEPQEYKIETIHDFLNVPADRRNACIEELFLDENGKVWQWEYHSEKTTEYPNGAIPNERGQILQKNYLTSRRRLVEVRMDTDWQNTGKYLQNQRWVAQDKGEE